MHAVGRIAYHGSIDNIQVSWVKIGVDGARQLLQAGVNDLGGTLMDENISRAAGASHGQEMTADDFRAIVEPLGRTLEQRTTLYGRVDAATARRLTRPTQPCRTTSASTSARPGRRPPSAATAGSRRSRWAPAAQASRRSCA